MVSILSLTDIWAGSLYCSRHKCCLWLMLTRPSLHLLICFSAPKLVKHNPHLFFSSSQNNTPFVLGTSPSLPATGVVANLNATANALNADSAR